ncbi:MAG: radical SAM protein [Methanobrevibacter sp.]|nr:radical SAM protein [Methanobrevibacter sp.]
MIIKKLNKCENKANKCYYENNLDIDIVSDAILFNKCCIIADEHKRALLKMPHNELKQYNRNSFLQSVSQKMEKINIPLTNNYTMCNNKIVCNNFNDTIKEVCVNGQCGCNIHCKMCVCDTKFNKEISNIYYEVLDLIKNNNLDVIRLNVGGEPFLEKNRAIDYIMSLTPNDCKTLRIITNGTLLNEDDINKLSTAKINLQITVSLHSIIKETYEKIENNRFFDRVIKNIELLNAHNLLTNINIVAQPDNIDEIYDFCKYFHDKNIFVHLLPIRYSDEHDLIINHPNLIKVQQDFPHFYGSH